jgi:hypothetical protein
VLNSLPVDAGAATPETHKKTPIGQKNSEAYLHIKSMVQKGCCTYFLLMQPQTHKKQQFVRYTATKSYASKPWCILRVHYLKWVLHSLPVDAGAATPETHKTHQQVRNAARPTCTSKAWCILIQQVSRIQRNVCPFPSLLQRIIAQKP